MENPTKNFWLARRETREKQQFTKIAHESKLLGLIEWSRNNGKVFESLTDVEIESALKEIG